MNFKYIIFLFFNISLLIAMEQESYKHYSIAQLVQLMPYALEANEKTFDQMAVALVPKIMDNPRVLLEETKAHHTVIGLSHKLSQDQNHAFAKKMIMYVNQKDKLGLDDFYFNEELTIVDALKIIAEKNELCIEKCEKHKEPDDCTCILF